jgi:uncharacterized protein DUF6951
MGTQRKMIRQDAVSCHYVVSTVTPITRIITEPGACGFTCKIEVKGTGRYEATVTLQSECKQIKRFAQEVSSVDFMAVVGGRYAEDPISQAASRCGLHPSCPIPCSLIKAVEVELGMAVKKNVCITFEG